MAAVSMVSFQPINRKDIPVNEKCSVCNEIKAEDRGRSWWAHPMSKDSTRLIDYIHEACLKRMIYFQKDCPMCRVIVNQNSLPILTLRDRIGQFLYKEAQKIPLIIGVIGYLQPYSKIAQVLSIGICTGIGTPDAEARVSEMPKTATKIKLLVLFLMMSSAFFENCKTAESIDLVGLVAYEGMVWVGGYALGYYMPIVIRSLAEKIMNM